MPSRIKTTLSNTEFVTATGNFDTTRAQIDRVIIHTSVGTAQSAMDRFGQYGTQVSAHYIVDLDGTLYHGLEETSTAYHAGDYAMNQRSIGIEHADNGDYNGIRPDTLYTESAALVNDICDFYNIPIDRTHILKHSEVIATGCPDALDIDRIVKEALALDTSSDPLSVCLAQHTMLVDLCNQKDATIAELQKQLQECQSHTTPQYVTSNPILTPATPPDMISGTVFVAPADSIPVTSQSVTPPASLSVKNKTSVHQSFFSKFWEALWGK